ncbi:MAG TPA: P-loop NTPase, partial [Gemmatimonadaceae bacterium]|nr:P-loop NTPase [Gemmatimonadaceae bacterium]
MQRNDNVLNFERATSSARPMQSSSPFSTLLVASGKGGVGTSIVAALAAMSAAARDERVLLVDASEGGGTLHHLFGVRPAHSLWMLTDARSQPDEALTDIGEGLTLVAGGTSGAAVAPANDAERRVAL